MAKFVADVIIELGPYVLSAIVPLLLSALGIRRLNRTQDEKRQTFKDETDQRIQRLEKDVADKGVIINNQKVIIESLKGQVGELQHYKILYDTLKEAHDALKADHDELRTELTAVKERLAVAEKNAEEKTKENDQQRVLILALENKIVEGERRCDDLKIKLDTYREIIQTLKPQALEVATEKPEPGEDRPEVDNETKEEN